MIPSRVRWFKKRRQEFLVWQTYAFKTKQLALTPRVAPGTYRLVLHKL
jgi:hypothetical protein